MMCDAIRRVEDDAVHSMIIDSSDKDESYMDSYNESYQDATVMMTCHFHHYHHRLHHLSLLSLLPHRVQYPMTQQLMNDYNYFCI